MIVIVVDPATAGRICERIRPRPILSLFPEDVPGHVLRNYIITYQDGSTERISEWDLFRAALEIDPSIGPENLGECVERWL